MQSLFPWLQSFPREGRSSYIVRGGELFTLEKEEVAWSRSIKCLGVQLDRRLSFGEHFRIARNKAILSAVLVLPNVPQIRKEDTCVNNEQEIARVKEAIRREARDRLVQSWQTRWHDEMAWRADRHIDIPPDPGACHLAGEKAWCGRLLPDANAIRPSPF